MLPHDGICKSESAPGVPARFNGRRKGAPRGDSPNNYRVVFSLLPLPQNPFGTYNPEGMNLKALRDVVEKIAYKGLRT